MSDIPTTEPRTSLEKVPEKLQDMLSGDLGMGPMAAALVPQMLPLLRSKLPDDPAQLDEVLVHLAGEVLDMRSDNAPPVTVAYS